MSVFSIMKKGRQQAKERDAEAAEKRKDEPVKQPYKHVPTHAAIDAMSGSPSSWRHEDRPKIMAQNRRRSAIAASSIRGSGLPRVGSSLSNVSYPDVYNTPVVPLPKNYSFSSMPAAWRSNDSQTDYFSHGGSLKGKEPASAAGLPRNAAFYSTPGTPRLGSGDGLQMGSRKPSAAAHNSSTRSLSVDARSGSSLYPSTDAGSVHHLHPAQRRVSGHSSTTDRHHPPSTRSTHFAKPRPIDPSSIRNKESARPAPAPLAGSVEPGSASSSVSGGVSSASSIASRGNTAASSVASITAPNEAKSAPTETAASNPPNGPTVPAGQPPSLTTNGTSFKDSAQVGSPAVETGGSLFRGLSKTQAESKPPKKKHRWSLRGHKTPAVATA